MGMKEGVSDFKEAGKTEKKRREEREITEELLFVIPPSTPFCKNTYSSLSTLSPGTGGQGPFSDLA